MWMDGNIEKEASQTLKIHMKTFSIPQKQKPNLIWTHEGKKFVKWIFTDLLNKNEIKIYIHSPSEGAVFACRKRCF